MQRMCNQFHSHESHFIFHRWSDIIIHAIWNFHARSKHTWVEENPHCVVQNKYQREFSMNVWLEVLDNKLIGSFFLPVFFCLTREIYLEFLKTVYYNCWKMWIYTWEETCGLCTTNHRSISALMPRNIWTKNIPIGRSPDLNSLDQCGITWKLWCTKRRCTTRIFCRCEL